MLRLISIWQSSVSSSSEIIGMFSMILLNCTWIKSVKYEQKLQIVGSIRPESTSNRIYCCKEWIQTRRKSERRPDVLCGPVSRQWWTVNHWVWCVTRDCRTKTVTATSYRNKHCRTTIACTQQTKWHIMTERRPTHSIQLHPLYSIQQLPEATLCHTNEKTYQ